MNENIFIAKQAEGKNKEDGQMLIKSKYQQYYGLTPSVPDTLLVCLLGKRVVGTMVVECLEAACAPLINHYDIPAKVLSQLFPCGMVQMSRLTASVSLARAAVCYAAAQFALNMRRPLALVEIKEAILALHRVDGVDFHPVVGAQLLSERTHPSVRIFYTTPPPPMLCTWQLAEVRDDYAVVLARAGKQVECMF